jgi:hypothetical protein
VAARNYFGAGVTRVRGSEGVSFMGRPRLTGSPAMGGVVSLWHAWKSPELVSSKKMINERFIVI